MILNLLNGLTWKVPKDYEESVQTYIDSKIEELPDTLPTLKISEHAEKHRVMPAGTPRPGPLDLNGYTKFLVEPIDNMSPDSSIQHQAIMKGAQGGFTMMLECIMCYFMGYAPADILFISATAELLERWGSRRLEPAIDSYELRKFIYAQQTNSKSKKSGDKTFSKEYFGCRLDMSSAQSAPGMRSTDKRILLRDEIDGAPPELRNNEGNWLDVSFVRTNAWADRRKVTDVSTPTTYEASQIWQEYLKGDQRKYKMPCPHADCGHEQFLEFEFNYKEKGYGLKPIYDNDNNLVEAVYICAACRKEIKNHHKTFMIGNGFWQPTAKSSNKFFRSYYWNSLYAPVGMVTWREIYEKYLEAKIKPNGWKSFINLYGGMPYRETGLRPKIEALNELSGEYLRGTVPDGVLYITAGGDVQAGAEKWRNLSNEELEKEIADAIELDIKKPGHLDKQKFPRIEIEFLGTGIGYRSWSIDYKVFHGKINNIDSGAWEKLTNYYVSLTEKSKVINDGIPEPVFLRDDGRQFPVQYTFIDAHDYANSQSFVYSYCERYNNFFPCMGFDALKQRKNERGDEATKDNIRRYRLSKIGEDTFCVQISTNYFKTNIYNRFNLLRNDTAGNPPGFMDHPKDYDKKYFSGLASEERLKDNTFRETGRAAEALDCKVYGMCAASLWLDETVKMWRDYWTRKGQSRREVEATITHIKILRDMEMESKRVN